jgi:hypothetical protein
MTKFSLRMDNILSKCKSLVNRLSSGISIRDNGMRHVMKLEDMIHEKLRHCGCSEWVLKRTLMSIFGKMINDHHDDVFIARFR